MNNIINYSSDVARLLTKGYGSISEPIYVDNNGQIQIATNVQANGGGGDQGLFKKTVNLSALDVNTYYPVVSTPMPGRGFNHIKLAVHLDSGTVPAWSTHASGFSVVIEVFATAAGWGTIPELSVILEDNYDYANAHPASYQQLHNSSRAVFYLRGGGAYFLYTDWDTTWTICEESITFSSQSVAPTTTRPANSIMRSKIWANLDGTASSLYDRTNNITTYLNYGAAGLAGSAISWMACWNGYELRAISKAETFNLVRDNGGDSRWVTLATEQTISGVKHFTGNLWWGSSNGGGYLNGGATNGGINSVRIGDDVWLGDCNVGGIMGMKSTGSNCGFYMYNSGGTQIGQVYCNGTGLYINKTLQLHPTSGSYTEGIRIYPYSGWSTFMLLGDTAGTATSGVTSNDWGIFNNNGTLYINKGTSSGAGNQRAYANANGWYFTKAYGAVWNDFAEYRKSQVKQAGYAITPDGELTTIRLMAGVRIISDTYGYAIGYMENNNTMMPVALSGRVLAYTYKDKSHYQIGDAVCSAPGGTVDVMTRDEIKEYPDRIIGIVNEIPDYDIWEPSIQEGGAIDPVYTNGRIWIDVR